MILFGWHRSLTKLCNSNLKENCGELILNVKQQVRFCCPGNKPKMPKPKKISDIDLKDKRVVIRVDFNVPMKDGKITNNQRITAAVPTINYALKKEAKSVVLLSHLGRPQGNWNEKLSLRPIAKELENLICRDVQFVEDCAGKKVFEACKDPKPGSVILLENLRFYPEEEGKGVTKDKKKVKANPDCVKNFRKCLSQLGDVYINDAFGTSHRAHSSMLGEGYKERAAGFLLDKELTYFAKVLDNPEKPFLAILGGAKIADKIPLILNLLNTVDMMIVAGGMAFTFLKVNNKMEIGKSLFDEPGSKLIPKIMEKATEKCVDIVLPVDFLCANKIAEKPDTVKVVSVKEGVPKDLMGLDVGPKSFDVFTKVICQAKTIVWNGPPGLFENDTFATGTKNMMAAVVSATKNGATTIVGGGDTATACFKFGGDKDVSHVSTGGGASLELLEGKPMPGVAALVGEKESGDGGACGDNDKAGGGGKAGDNGGNPCEKFN